MYSIACLREHSRRLRDVAQCEPDRHLKRALAHHALDLACLAERLERRSGNTPRAAADPTANSAEQQARLIARALIAWNGRTAAEVAIRTARVRAAEDDHVSAELWKLVATRVRDDLASVPLARHADPGLEEL